MEDVYTPLHPILLTVLWLEYKPRTPGGETEAQTSNVTCPGHAGGEGSEPDRGWRVSVFPPTLCLAVTGVSIRLPAVHSFMCSLPHKHSESTYSVSCTLRSLGNKRNQTPLLLSWCLQTVGLCQLKTGTLHIGETQPHSSSIQC